MNRLQKLLLNQLELTRQTKLRFADLDVDLIGEPSTAKVRLTVPNFRVRIVDYCDPKKFQLDLSMGELHELYKLLASLLEEAAEEPGTGL